MAGELENTTTYDTMKMEIDRLCSQLDTLLEENRTQLGSDQQLPVAEFTLNPRRLQALQDKLTQAEVEVVRGVERSRLEKLLQCHYLKDAAWDNMLVKARALCDDDDDDDDEDEEDEEDEESTTTERISSEDLRLLLYPQLDLNTREKVETQLILLQFVSRQLKEAFNARFDSIHQRKERVIEEVKRLTRKRRQLKEELTKIREEEEKEALKHGEEEGGEEMDEERHKKTPIRRRRRRSRRNIKRKKNKDDEEEEEEEEEEDYEPTWKPEERPELMLQVDESQITSEVLDDGEENTPTKRSNNNTDGEAKQRK
ncbi:hypothetical protein Pcinc_038996 [Petrolisthes cinctipes]|uniref:Uncharacterized protein n=1 Tax=Petrolisthes cinctipes TaxID=88211 RepID=A0AAE1EJW6_PETCI|nr:hypothetical protein Pcinc_038996 [Petrolisthes cinctipes]